MEPNAVDSLHHLINKLFLSLGAVLLVLFTLLVHGGCESQPSTQTQLASEPPRMGNLYSLSRVEEDWQRKQSFFHTAENDQLKKNASRHASATWKVTTDGSGDLLLREKPKIQADVESEVFFDRLYERNGVHAFRSSLSKSHWEKREDGVRLGYQEDRRDKDFIGDDWIHEGR